MPIQSVKKKSGRFLQEAEISDYTNYETITPIHSPPLERLCDNRRRRRDSRVPKL